MPQAAFRAFITAILLAPAFVSTTSNSLFGEFIFTLPPAPSISLFIACASVFVLPVAMTTGSVFTRVFACTKVIPQTDCKALITLILLAPVLVRTTSQSAASAFLLAGSATCTPLCSTTAKPPTFSMSRLSAVASSCVSNVPTTVGALSQYLFASSRP